MAAEVIEVTGEVITDPKAWAEERFDAITRAAVGAWEVVLELAREWDTGLRVGQFYTYTEEEWKGHGGQTMTIAAALRRYWQTRREAAGLSPTHTKDLANAAQIYLMAGEPENVTPYALRPFGPPDKWTPDKVREQLARVQERWGDITYSNVRNVLHPAKLPTPYWQQVIYDIQSGAHLLTPALARNVIATAKQWLEDHPDAPTRR